MILGNNGSGKSYLAGKLAAATGFPLIHLDAEFWRPGWVMPSEDEWREKMARFVSGDKWIIDGIVSLGSTLDMRFAAADLIVFLDVNRLACLAGIIKRQGKRRPDTAQGHELDEKFDRRFFGFCQGIWRFPKSARRRAIMELREKYSDKPFYIVKGRKRMNRFIDQWGKDTPV